MMHNTGCFIEEKEWPKLVVEQTTIGSLKCQK